MENNNKSDGILKIVGFAFMLIGITLFLLGLVLILNYNDKSKKYIETTSYVVDYEQKGDSTYSIIVQYRVDGKTYKKTSNVATSSPKKIGSKVSIKYNPNNPNEAIWTKDYTNLILPILGGVFIVVGIILFIVSGKVKKDNIKKIKEENELYTSPELDKVIENSDNKKILNKK